MTSEIERSGKDEMECVRPVRPMSRSTRQTLLIQMIYGQTYLDGISTNTVLLTFTSLFADISTEMLYSISII